jgi:hypothetical protein
MRHPNLDQPAFPGIIQLAFFQQTLEQAGCRLYGFKRRNSFGLMCFTAMSLRHIDNQQVETKDDKDNHGDI